MLAELISAASTLKALESRLVALREEKLVKQAAIQAINGQLASVRAEYLVALQAVKDAASALVDQSNA
jgi:hypothetical protein